MAVRLPKKYYLIFALFALSTIAAIYWVSNHIIKQDIEAHDLRLEQANAEAAAELKDALTNYATFLTGIKTVIEIADEMPSQEALQDFVKRQANNLTIDPPFSISYIDTNHIFIYDFDKDQIDPSNLRGTSMRDIIGDQGIVRMDTLMRKDLLYVSSPTNLIEGKVALPYGFGVLDSLGRSRGYVTAVFEFMPIVNRVYQNVSKEEFVYKFMSDSGAYFDRTRAYNGQKVYATEEDPEYFENFDLSEQAYISTQIPFYNKVFTVSTAYKEENLYSTNVIIGYSLWLLAILGFMLFLISQFYLYEKTNKKIAAQKQQLSELVATKNKFFSIIAHDLRSPLSSVINFLDVLKGEEFGNKQTNEIFKQLEDSSKNSISLLDNLLKWSKVQTGQISFHPESIDILKITKDQIKVQQHLLDEKGLKVRLESSYNGKVEGDKNMIATIIRNLLSNAIKFSHKKGIIVIEINKIGSYLSFSIEDNGIGIPEQYMGKLLDVTTVTRQSGTSNEKGSGLGLILCDQFVKAHQGKFDIESQHNKGTIVTILLPL